MQSRPFEGYDALIERAERAAANVVAADAASAHRVVVLARELQARPRNEGLVIPTADDSVVRRELNRHFELLGRRGARALPLAALARALLADLSGTRRELDEALSDCEKKLSMFGL